MGNWGVRLGAATAAAVLSVVIAAPASAAPGDLGVQRVVDLNPGAGNGVGAELKVMNGAIYFAGNDGVHGVELWRTDGTSTTIVKDINPEAGSSNPNWMTVVGSTLYFAASDGSNGTELWKSDGTGPGTAMVANINPGSSSSDPNGLVAWNGLVVFGAEDGTNGMEPWKSNGGGLGSGTSMVADVNPAGLDSDPYSFTPIGPAGFYFGATDTTVGKELRFSDGSSVTFNANIKTNGGGDAQPLGLTHLGGNVVVFTAFDDDFETELWRSDGTEPGTDQVGDINPGTASSSPNFITKADGEVIFNALGPNGYEPWKSDGTTNTEISNIGVGPGVSYPFGFTYLPDLDVTYFSTSNGTDGNELYRTDGDTVVYVANIGSGSSDGNPQFFNEVGGTVFFLADDGSHGLEPYRTDGTALGTKLITDINPGAPGSWELGRAELNGTLYLAANDGGSGVEMHRTFIEQAPPAEPPATPVPAKKCKKGQKLKKGKCVKKKRKKRK